MDKKERIWSKAKETVGDKSRMKKVLDDSLNKLKNISQNSGEFQEFIGKIKIFIRMIKAHISGEYHAFSRKTILLTIFALLYFVIPTDVIPDFIPALGLTDDISLVYFIYKQIEKDIAKFLQAEID